MRILSEFRRQNDTKESRESRSDRRERTRFEQPNSLWRETGRRWWFPSPSTDLDSDVVIVGAGFTGLWTAVLLSETNPSLSIAVLEAVQPGFGTGARTTGWCTTAVPQRESITRHFGEDAADRLRLVALESLDRIGAYAELHGIDCGWTRSGSLTVATNTMQEMRLRREAGAGEHSRFIGRSELSCRVAVANGLGALFDPDSASLDPRNLLDGLVRRCTELGVRIFGNTTVEEIKSDHVIARGESGLVYATTRNVIVATGAFTSFQPRNKRAFLPLYFHAIATDPLPGSFWADVGWSGRETLLMDGHLAMRAQRTTDGRIVLAGRGARYPFGSDIHSSRDTNTRVHDSLTARLRDMFPAAGDFRVSHSWGGPTALSRDLLPGVWTHARTGVTFTGGPGTHHVGTSHLIARIVSGRFNGDDAQATGLALNNHQPPRWAPEPLRWLDMNTRLVAARSADAAGIRGSTARLAGSLPRIT